jgi:hypothetical protein
VQKGLQRHTWMDELLFNPLNGKTYMNEVQIQGDQKISVHQMITVQKTRKNILNSFNHLP